MSIDLTKPTALDARASSPPPLRAAAAARLWPLLAAALLAAPLLFSGDYHLRFAAEILMIGTAVMSLDILIGFGGLVSLGHAALFGGAAYAAALVAMHFGSDLFVTLLTGIVTGVALAAVIGCVVVRTVNLFFLILTLVTAQMLWELVFRSREVTGGADGLRGLPPLKLHLGFDTWLLTSASSLYIVSACVALASLWVARSFIKAPLGRALIGTREQPLRMIALGYSIPAVRLWALIVSGGIAGAAGALYPFVNLYVGPNVVHWTMSAMMIIALVIGGVGSLYGAFIGSAIYLGFQTYVSSYTDRWQLVVGAVFVLTVVLMPHGIVNAFTAFRHAKTVAAGASSHSKGSPGTKRDGR